jgi:hypothetical protein
MFPDPDLDMILILSQCADPDSDSGRPKCENKSLKKEENFQNVYVVQSCMFSIESWRLLLRLKVFIKGTWQ